MCKRLNELKSEIKKQKTNTKKDAKKLSATIIEN